MEQNQLRTELHDWGRQLCEQLVEYEAKLCQAKSERDFLLNEKKKARNSNGSNNNSPDGADEVLERMIEDAMEEAVVESSGVRGGSKKSKTSVVEVQSGNGDTPSRLQNGIRLERYVFKVCTL